VDEFIDEIELMLKRDEVSLVIGCYGQDLKTLEYKSHISCLFKTTGELFNTGESSES
jgi:hypothetical protein